MILRRRTERAIGQIIWLGYFVLPIVGFSAAWWIRFKSGLFAVPDFQPYDEYKIPILIVASFWAIVFAARGLHKPDITCRFHSEAVRIAAASLIAMVFPMALSFTYRGYFYSRLVMAMGTAITYLLCLAHKELAKFVVRHLVLKKIGVAKKLIIGCGDFAQKVVDAMRKDPYAAAGIVGMVSLPGERCTADLPYLGDIDNLRELLIKHNFDEVIVAHPNVDEDTILRIIYECRKEFVQFELVPPFWNLLRGKIVVERIGDVHLTAFADVAMKG